MSAMDNEVDVIVIGAGPAGYVAALRCAQLGLKTVCVDDWVNPEGQPAPGGTCLNVGCIPSKALLESSEHYAHALHGLQEHGVTLGGVALDLERMHTRKRRVVAELTQGIAHLLKANRVEWRSGRGQLLADKRVRVAHRDGSHSELQAAHIILAPGSTPVRIDSVPQDDERVVDSSGALEFTEVPRRLGIIGAGVIGLELGSVWKRLGAEQVTLLEAQAEFLPMADRQVAREAQRSFARQGLDIRLNCRVLSNDTQADRLVLRYQDGETERSDEFDKLIVAVGRRPRTQGLAADEASLLLDEWGLIHVDGQCRTNLPGVYAIGDAVRGPMLAHKGSEEGVMVAELIAGRVVAEVDHAAIPAVIYTLPEIAWVGQTEQALQAAGLDYRSGVFPFSASGRARAMGACEGFVKLLADATTDRVLGAHMIGAQCSELIAEAVLAMRLGASSEDIALTIFAHPSLSESVHEAALAVDGRALHSLRKAGSGGNNR